ncbi:MAG TPA: hypothetical protein VFU23_03570, partial [Gemmatimonadales bacterium]|nr:hypothetical protein [Gemmatimonadales bacterium]
TDFEIPCRIDGPDSVARVPVVKGTIEPGWIGSYHTVAWGARNRGLWPEGAYRITCRELETVVATSEFTVVKATAAVGVLGASLTHLRFYQSLAERLPIESRLYGARFDARTARWVKTEFGLVYPAVPAPVTFTVECVYTFPDGTLRPVSVERQVPAGWTGSVHAQGLGWDRAGNWQPGGYRVSCRSEGREFAAGSFEVFDGSTPAAATAGSSLKFFGRRSGAAGPPAYAQSFEAGAFDTLYAEASLPTRAAGDSTAFRCLLTDPAGVTSGFALAGEIKDRALVGSGRISPLDAPRMRGTYRVECRAGPRSVAVDRFDVTGTADLPALDARVVASALYEGPDAPPGDESVSDVTFAASKLRSLWLVALLDHPGDQGAGSVTWSCRITGPRNAVIGDTGPLKLTLAPGDRSLLLRQRFVPPPRRWAPGHYNIGCASGAVTFLRTGFDLTR